MYGISPVSNSQSTIPKDQTSDALSMIYVNYYYQNTIIFIFAIFINKFIYTRYKDSSNVTENSLSEYVERKKAIKMVTYLEYFPHLIVSGGIHAYVPAADIRVVLYTSRANPKSEILSVLFLRLSCSSIGSLISTENERKNRHLKC